MMPSAVLIENLSFGYGSRHVLEDVSLEIERGDFACLVGPNGGGKTTLLKLILGLLKPDRGRVRVLGLPPEEARQKVGYMPQHANLDPLFPVTAMDVVLMGRLGRHRWFGSYRRTDRLAGEAALEEVGLAGSGRVPFAALSGGQRQRVLIARALVDDPELLLLDEPTANLDPQAEGELYALLQRLNRRMTIVLVSHDLGFVSQFVRRVICVNRRVFTHPTVELTGEMVQEIYDHGVRMVRHDRGDDR